MSFVHLHVHTEYSLLDGFSNIPKLVERAHEMDMPAIAITDHGTMFGVIEFFNAAKQVGIKPIIGLEAYLAARTIKEHDPQEDKRSSHLLLLAENATGYKNLLKLASIAQLEGFYYFPRIDHDILAQHAEGLICTSGCMSAEIPRLLQRGLLDQADQLLGWYYDLFGPDNFFLELQRHPIPELDAVNKQLLELGQRHNARFVATNDVHYIDKKDARLQDIMLAIQTGSLLSDPKRMRMTSDTYYLRSPQEMAELFAETPDALSNTLLIAERCDLDLGFKGYHLPKFDVPPRFTANSYLRQLCEAGLSRRYGDQATDPKVRERLDYELQIIHKMGFDTYFLIVWDLCRYAREQGIWYNARGSGNGSIVAYCLDITLVEPIHHGLIFERFLNPGRISMPDIDLDFRDDCRSEMLQYAANKFGDDRVAQIITFGTLGARAAIRDVGRVKDIPLSEVDRVAKVIPNIPGKPITLKEALVDIPEFKQMYESEGYLRELIDTAAEMEGVVRNAGTHAAGVVIADRPLLDYVPLHRPTGTATTTTESPIKIVTQFEMGVIDSLGLLKVDFLGLSTLTIMARACDLIHQRHGIQLTLDNIPTDDPATYALLGRGETAGVFQVEGSGMRRWLMQMKPTALENVIAMVALFRPGPMEYIPAYIRRMHGEEAIQYRHPLLEPLFKETYGFPVYQEQLMYAAMQLAGYSPSESDDLRKAISKKIKDKLHKHKEKFIRGAVARGIEQETASAIFEDWEEFARYGFNKCLPGDTEIIDASTGQVVTLEDLYHGRAQLTQTISCATDTLRLQASGVARVMDNGFKPVYCLKTALGRTIEATANHPFYTYEGWKILDHLQVGELIATPRCLPVEGHTTWPEHEVIALGHLLAEGNLCHPNSVYFYSQAEAQVCDFVQAAEAFPNVNCSVTIHKTTFSVYAKRQDRKQLPGIVLWAKGLGIWGKNARQKTIPSAVFELNNRQIGLLISRMWEGDGHIDVTGRSLFYATASERMARQLQHLLLRLGIISRLRKVTFNYKEGRTGYQLFITKHSNFQTFAEQIGCYFINQERKAKLDMLLQAGIVLISTKDIIPMQVKELVRMAKEREGVTWLEMNTACGVAQREFYPTHTSAKRGYTRETIGRLADYFDDSDLRRYAENDLYWDEIIAIEFAGQKQTYDLEVPGTHNFIANDIIVHNSHAADYGIIAVQTGYLKCHYPEEYMTAVLSNSQSDAVKVALYVADCRRMGIDVQPPSVNTSGWDFTIENRPDLRCAIRFGLGAVKNVGHGPVNAILEARIDNPYTDINDFARRVDLRQVGKRPLECLIRVGALDQLGPRSAMLSVLDQILSISASHFRASDLGQMSIFGAHTGISDEIVLPKGLLETNRREILEWERELIGLYVSDHPLSPVMDALTQAVSHFSAQLSEAAAGEKVRVAGIVTRVRPHQTKTGKSMGFVTLEDLQGTIELVVFPRTWEQYWDVLAVDSVVLVDGKVDAQSGDPKVLVDSVTTDLKSIVSAEPPLPPSVKPFSPTVKPFPIPPARVDDLPSQPEDWGDSPPPPDEFPPAWKALEIAPGGFVIETGGPSFKANIPTSMSDGTNGGNTNPPVEVVTVGSDRPSAVSNEPTASRDEPSTISLVPISSSDQGPTTNLETTATSHADIAAASLEPGNTVTEAYPASDILSPAAVETVSGASESTPMTVAPIPPVEQAPPVNIAPVETSTTSVASVLLEPVAPPPSEASVLGIEAPRVGITTPPSEPAIVVPPYILPPAEAYAGQDLRMITVILRCGSDKVRDNLRLRQCYGIMISYSGHDRFALQIFERNRGYRIEFPNYTTLFSPELVARLASIVGADNVIVEPLRLH